MNYKEWLGEWLNSYVKLSAKTRTVVRYEQIVHQHIVPHLGACELDSITPIILQKFVTKLVQEGNLRTGKGLSPNAVNSVITVLQSSLSAARGSGLMHSSPASKIKRPKLVESEIVCFSVAEQKSIEKAVFLDKRTYMFGVILCLYTGIRIGELLALTWQDIDFVNGIISITKTCYDGMSTNGKFGRLVDTPKTPSSKRKIPLPKQLVSFMKNIKKRSESDCVISKKGEPFLVRTYQRNFSALLKRLNIEHRGFHALRHTFATRAIECGVDVKTLSEILGHKNATITLNRYAHSLMEHKREMMNRIGSLCDLSQKK